jgi:hypothetical protein
MSGFWKPGAAEPAAVPAVVAGPPAEPPQPPQPAYKMSANLANMKFMKRKEEAAEQNKEEGEKRRKLLDAMWTNPTPQPIAVAQQPRGGSGKLVCVVEAVDLYSTLPGRRSFGGFNAVVERHYSNALNTSLDEPSGAMDVEEESILKKYEELVSLPRGPNQGKAKKPKAPTGGIGQHGQQVSKQKKSKGSFLKQ